MKFSQFLELEEKLLQNGHTIKELKEAFKTGDDDKLYEFFGINKAVASWGVSKIMKVKLDNQAKKFIADTEETIKNAIGKLVKTKKSIKEQMMVLKKAKKPIPEETARQIMEIERRIIRIVNNTIDDLGKKKSEQIEERIDSSKKMKDSAKLGLKYLWTKLMSDAKIQLLTFLMKQKVIETAGTVKALQNYLTKEEEGMKEKAKKVNQEIKSAGENKETEAEGEKKGGEL